MSEIGGRSFFVATETTAAATGANKPTGDLNMDHLEWTKDLNTGVNVIDKQHRRIVDYINQLVDATETGDNESISDVFDGLIDYTITHFTFEEGLQEKAGYEFRSAHQRVHKVFIKKLGEYKKDFDDGNVDAVKQVNRMLRNWLINHIKNDDADYVPAVQKMLGTEKKSGWLSRSLGKFFGGSDA